MKSYFQLLKDSTITTIKGMAVTLKVFQKVWKKGPVTIEYPEIKDLIPVNSRGILFNDVVDCTACKQCAAICPSKCIHIEAVKKDPTEPKEYTRNGTRKTFSLKKYTIDISLCCFCGLCVEACPTKSLFHTKEYEFSTISKNSLIINCVN